VNEIVVDVSGKKHTITDQDVTLAQEVAEMCNEYTEDAALEKNSLRIAIYSEEIESRLAPRPDHIPDPGKMGVHENANVHGSVNTPRPETGVDNLDSDNYEPADKEVWLDLCGNPGLFGPSIIARYRRALLASHPSAKAETGGDALSLAEKHSREWLAAVSNDYDHEAPRWAYDLASEQKTERDALLASRGQAVCKSCDFYEGCEHEFLHTDKE
jgi:hypothetical protein